MTAVSVARFLAQAGNTSDRPVLGDWVGNLSNLTAGSMSCTSDPRVDHLGAGESREGACALLMNTANKNRDVNTRTWRTRGETITSTKTWATGYSSYLVRIEMSHSRTHRATGHVTGCYKDPIVFILLLAKFIDRPSDRSRVDQNKDLFHFCFRRFIIYTYRRTRFRCFNRTTVIIILC